LVIIFLIYFKLFAILQKISFSSFIIAISNFLISHFLLFVIKNYLIDNKLKLYKTTIVKNQKYIVNIIIFMKSLKLFKRSRVLLLYRYFLLKENNEEFDKFLDLCSIINEKEEKISEDLI
jgi:hypothetical protein